MIRIGWLCLFLLSWMSSAVQAGLIVQVRNSEVMVGGVGWIDVEMYASDGESYLVSLATYKFEITADDGAIGQLQFVTTQRSAERALPNYLFASQDPNNLTVGAYPDQQDPQVLEGGSSTDDFSEVRVTSDRKLLVRLDVEHLLPMETDPNVAVGSQYTISLVSIEATPGDVLELTPSTISGKLQIVATPEPTSLALVAIAGVGWRAMRNRKRSKRAASAPAGDAIL